MSSCLPWLRMRIAETAAIVPASFGGWRSDALYSPFEDIRQNLFMHFKYAELKQQAKKPSYVQEAIHLRYSCLE